MNISKRLKLSRFILSCIFLSGYAAYTVYAIYYYRNYEDSRIGGILLCLIGSALALNIVITCVSYRINLKDKKRPKIHRFLKMAKYLFQLIASAITIALVFSAVQNTNAFSLIMSAISVPFLIWSLFVNVLAELFDYTVRSFRKKEFYRPPVKDEDGAEIDVRSVISRIDGTENTLRQMNRNRKNKKDGAPPEN